MAKNPTVNEALGLKDRLNLSVLKTEDEAAIRVLCTLSHVSLFSYNQTSESWDATGVEGCCLFYQRNSNPPYSVKIFSRIDQNDVVIPFDSLRENIEFHSDNSLFFLFEANDLFGIWIASAKDVDILKELFKF